MQYAQIINIHFGFDCNSNFGTDSDRSVGKTNLFFFESEMLYAYSGKGLGAHT